jgi:hypothetical protein
VPLTFASTAPELWATVSPFDNRGVVASQWSRFRLAARVQVRQVIGLDLIDPLVEPPTLAAGRDLGGAGDVLGGRCEVGAVGHVLVFDAALILASVESSGGDASRR